MRVEATAARALILPSLIASASSFDTATTCFVPSRSRVVRHRGWSNPPSTKGVRICGATSAFPLPLPDVRNACASGASRSSTSLSMGLRSFIKKRFRRGRKDDDDEEELSPGSTFSYDEEDTQEEEEEQVEEEEEYAPELMDLEQDESVTASGPYAAVEEISHDNDARSESIRERINRVKSGSMTEEEKSAFLNMALTPLPTQREKRGPPIRQRLPSDAEGGGNGGGKGKSSSSGVKPSDPLWSTVISRTPSSAASAVRDGGAGQGGNSASGTFNKKQWFDMVTDPDRFKTYSSVVPEADEPNKDDPDTVEPATEESEETQKSETAAALEALKDIQGVSPDLAKRLEVAAVEQERRDAETRKKAEEKRAADAARAAEIQRTREEEFQRRVSEAAEKKRAEEEKEARVEIERREAELERLREAQAAQDAYWAQKVEEEQQRKKRHMTDEDKEKEASRQEEEKKRRELEVEKEAERSQLREAERAREGKHEEEILKEAEADSIHDREYTRDIVDKSVAEVSRTDQKKVPKEDVSVSAFVREQERKRIELEEMLELRRQQLKSLSSPIPARGQPPAVSPFPTSAPQTESKAPSSPSSSAGSLSDLTNTINPTTSDSVPPSAPPIQSGPAPTPAPRLSLAEMTMLKKDADNDSKAVSTPSASPRLSLAEMTKLNKDAAPEQPRARAPPSPARTVGAAKKRPVRQKLPISNNSLSDDDDGVVGKDDRKSMTIADYMKQTGKEGAEDPSDTVAKKDAERDKARMWGVDIDKLL